MLDVTFGFLLRLVNIQNYLTVFS